MSYITKKQSSLALLVIVFATLLIAGTILSSTTTDNSAFAKKHKKGTHQKIDQSTHQKQKAFCVTAGANSGVSGSCNNAASSTNNNNGGNAAASSGGSGHGSKQKIDQSTHQKQEAFCVTAGANSGVSGSCNNAASSTNNNNGGNAAASSGGSGHGSDQKIDQSTHQKQKAFCVSAGANSPIITSCNNSAASANANGAGNGAVAT